MSARLPWILALVSCAVFGNRCQASISVLPLGVHNDVSISTVINTWGWSVVYDGKYRDAVTINTMFAGAGDYVMLAAYQQGSETFDILAATLKSDVLTYTPLHVTHASNGAQWYFNGFSMGFAGLGDAIRQQTADVMGSTWGGFGPDENDRLSWHTGLSATGMQDHSVAPTHVIDGWRAGYVGDKNTYDDSWRRMILTGDLRTNVAAPEMASVVTWSLLGATGSVAVWRRRRRTAC